MTRDPKSNISISKYLVLISILIASCLQEIPIEVEKIDEQLVVQGFINTTDNTHRVRLFSTIQLNNMAANRTLGEGANLEILEIDGPTYPLSEIAPGIYETEPNAIIPETGKSYQLKIELSNGDQYESTVETVQKPLEVLFSKAVFEERFIEKDNGTTERLIGHDLIFELKNTEETHYFFVQNKGWLEVEVLYIPNCTNVPPPFCWTLRDPIVSNKIIIGSNQLVGESSYSVNSLNVPVDFRRPYVAILGISAISKETFLFWSSVNEQLSRPGSIFDAPVAPIVGNISQTNGNKTALGYFHTYSVIEEIICFDRTDIPVIQPIPILETCISCVEYWNPATYDNIEASFCED